MVPVILGCITLTCVLYNGQIISSPAGLRFLVNSDSLLPMQMAWDLHHNPLAWRYFQWPRVPSLFPDMLYFWACEWLGIGWRHAFLGYSLVMIALLVFALGIVIKHLQRRADLASCCAVAAMATLAVIMVASAGARATGLENWKDLLLVLAPVTHGDGLILSLLAAPAAIAAWRGNRSARTATLVLCALGTFCDLLFVVQFLIPFVLATRLPALHRAGRRAVLPAGTWADLRLLGAMSLACTLGWAMTLPLFRQSVTAVKLRWPTFVLSHLGHDLVHAPWAMVCILGTAALALTAWRRAAAVLRSPVTGAAWDDQTLLLVLAALSAALSLGLLLFLYFDVVSWRYALAALWWPLAAALSRVPWLHGRGLPWRSAMGGVAALALGATMAATAPPALLTWHSPLARCVTANTGRNGLRAGLATYWFARQTEASSDWTLQIAQMTGLGKQRIWGNDAALYAADSHDPHRPAPFNFIVMSADVDKAAILHRFGRPMRQIACSEATIWQYPYWLHPPS